MRVIASVLLVVARLPGSAHALFPSSSRGVSQQHQQPERQLAVRDERPQTSLLADLFDADMIPALSLTCVLVASFAAWTASQQQQTLASLASSHHGRRHQLAPPPRRDFDGAAAAALVDARAGSFEPPPP